MALGCNVHNTLNRCIFRINAVNAIIISKYQHVDSQISDPAVVNNINCSNTQLLTRNQCKPIDNDQQYQTRHSYLEAEILTVARDQG